MFNIAFNEILAEACQRMLVDSKAVEKLTELRKKDKGLFNKLKQFITDFFNKVKARYKNLEPTSMEAKHVQEIEGMSEKLQKLFEDALLDAAENQRIVGTQKNTAQSGVKMQLKQIPTESEIESNIQKIVNMDSVIKLNGTEFEKGKVDLITQVTDYFDSIGGFVEAPYGKVELTRTGVKSSIGHGIGRNKSIAFRAVPDVLAKGKIVDCQANWKQRGYDTVVVAAPITIGEKG